MIAVTFFDRRGLTADAGFKNIYVKCCGHSSGGLAIIFRIKVAAADAKRAWRALVYASRLLSALQYKFGCPAPGTVSAQQEANIRVRFSHPTAQIGHRS